MNKEIHNKINAIQYLIDMGYDTDLEADNDRINSIDIAFNELRDLLEKSDIK